MGWMDYFRWDGRFPICASRDTAGGGASTIEVFGYPQCILRRGEVIPVHSSAFYLVAR